MSFRLRVRVERAGCEPCGAGRLCVDTEAEAGANGSPSTISGEYAERSRARLHAADSATGATEPPRRVPLFGIINGIVVDT